MIKQITSVQNSFIKHVLLLKEKSRERKKQGAFIIEGKRELSLAIKGGYHITTLLFYSDLFSETEAKALSKYSIEIIGVSKEVYQKLAYRDTTEGVIAIVTAKEHSLNNITFKRENPLILVAEAPEKPGNIGALLRTADAAHLDGVIIANPKTDIYNPNIIRSSVGCVFTNQIGVGTTAEVIQFLKAQHIQIYCMALSASKHYHTLDYQDSTAFVVGTEAVGLSKIWLENSTQNIIIPMQGEIDSMNVSVSAAIAIFEAKRQRNFL